MLKLQHKVQGTMYANDLAIWASKGIIITAKIQMWEALKSLESWNREKQLKIYVTETTYTVFSLSTTE